MTSRRKPAKRKPPPKQGLFENRSVVEIIVLLFTMLIVGVLGSITIVVGIVEVIDPTVDTSNVVDALIRIITSLIAALFGLMVGTSQMLHNRQDGSTDLMRGSSANPDGKGIVMPGEQVK